MSLFLDDINIKLYASLHRITPPDSLSMAISKRIGGRSNQKNNMLEDDQIFDAADTGEYSSESARGIEKVAQMMEIQEQDYG